MGDLTANDFWNAYGTRIRKDATKSLWNNTTKWTEFCKHAAEEVMDDSDLETKRGFKVHPSREYFRIDVIGERKFDDCDWTLAVAFEHENMGQNRWIQEFCKLAHVVADLRVIAGYFDPKFGDLTTFLQDRVNLMQSRQRRITRVPDSEWLFIFGPQGRKTFNRDGTFRAFTLNGTKVVPLNELDIPLCPYDWPA